MRPLLVLTTVAALSLAGARARAQAQSDSQVAQALFDEARELMDKHEYVRACPLLERSQTLDPGGGTLLNLALCWEGAGKLARASTTFQAALEQAYRDGQHTREQIATAHIDALAPRLPRLRLFTRETAGPLVVYFDDTIEGSEVLGALTPVDPGPHHVRVTAAGRTPWEWSGSLAEGERKELEITLSSTPPPNPCLADPSACAPPEPKKRVSAMTWVFGGVSLLSAVAAGITGGISLSAKNSFESNCIAARGYCSNPTQGQQDYDLMQATAWASTITVGVAVLAAVVAAVWPRVTVSPAKTGGSFVFRF